MQGNAILIRGCVKVDALPDPKAEEVILFQHYLSSFSYCQFLDADRQYDLLIAATSYYYFKILSDVQSV